MEALATDKSKLSMEGLLKLEQRITQMQHSNYFFFQLKTRTDLKPKFLNY